MIPGSVVVKFEHQVVVANQILHSVEELCRVGKECVSRRRIETRLNGLNEDWQKFSGNHKILVSEIAVFDESIRTEIKGHAYFNTNIFTKTREAFLEAFENMTTLLDGFQDASHSGGSSIVASTGQSIIPGNHRLPRLEIPTFDGDHTEWLTFRDMFSSIVLKNSSLSDIEKLQYLKTSLSGSAASFLKHTALTGDNFQRSWSDLMSYYDNKRILVDSNLHTLFSIKRMQTESASELEGVYNTVQQTIRSLEMLGQPVKHWDAVLIYLTTRCLDQNTIKAWELQLGSSTEYPKWNQLGQFIISRIRSLQTFARSSSDFAFQSQSAARPEHPFPNNRQSKSHSVQQTSPRMRSCPICGNDHHTWTCPEFILKPVDRKVALIKEKGLCFNCLGPHLASQCPSSRRCQKCSRKHHSSIHTSEPYSHSRASVPSDSFGVIPEPKAVPVNRQVFHAAPASQSPQSSVLLATALAKIELHPGYLVNVRLLIDQGSEVPLVTEHFVRTHGIPRRKSYMSIMGAGAHSVGCSKGSVVLKLKSNVNPNFSYLISAEILLHVTGDIPSIKPTHAPWAHLNGIELADPNFCDPAPVDIIPGGDVYAQIIQNDLIKGKEGEPIAQLTTLGWIITGPFHQILKSNSVGTFH